jgi:hypothetical protein
MQILLTLTALAAITLALGGKSSLCLRHRARQSMERASGATRPDQAPVGRPTSRRKLQPSRASACF